MHKNKMALSFVVGRLYKEAEVCYGEGNPIRQDVMLVYPAHIRPNGERQTVREHCRNTAALAANALRAIGLEKSAFLAGLLHDAGKNKREYEQYLLKAACGGKAVRGSVKHTFAGVRFLLDRWHGTGGECSYSDVASELLAFAAGAHHGLFDCIDARRESGFWHRQTGEGIFYDESIRNFLEQCAGEEELNRLFWAAVCEMTPMLNRLSALSGQRDDNEANRETAFYIGLLARMLLSAVIEGDRADTAAFMDGTEPSRYPADMRPVWAERLAFMEAKLSELPRKTSIDRARRRISDDCASAAARPGGVCRLNVPTGGGKTLAGLRFALTHAAKWKKSRIVFTAPLLSILDQNAPIIRRFVGDDTLVLEHHSNLVEPKETPERLQESELLADSWNAPILITTLVQLLNTCFSGKTGAIRRFHALCGSVIVIDEVQTVPHKMLTLFNLAVNFLSEICGATVVLCSATQPCLEAAAHPLHRKPVDLVPYRKELWEVFRRTEIQNAGCARLEEFPQIVMRTLEQCGSLLVVCNTKKEAAFLFERLQGENCRCFHLSAAMCVEHRRQTLRDLQAAMDRPFPDKPKVVCLSTQVIEAGVDISFQRVIRFSAGMDSVVQAAGRCNRHAEQAAPAPVSLIRCTDERLRGLDDILRGQNATTALLTAFERDPEKYRHDLSSQEAIGFYYRRLYGEMEGGFQDSQTPEHGSVYRLLADNPRYADADCAQAGRYFLRQAFRLAGGLFQVFDEDTVSLLVPYGKGCEIQNALLDAANTAGQKDWASIRGRILEAKGYCVSVYRYQLERLQALGAVTGLFDGAVQILSGFYHAHTGFSLDAGILDFQEV